MGVIIGLCSAASVAALNIFLKKLHTINPHVLTFFRVASALPVLIVVVTFFVGWALPEKTFWLLLLGVIVPTEIVLAYVGTKSVHLSPISLMAPLGAFTSIFLIPVGYVILGELPTTLGFLGVLIIFFGSFFLGWQRGKSIAHGLSSIMKEKGTSLALLSALLSSITISVTKLSYEYAPPLLAAFYIYFLLTITLIPAVWYVKRRTLKGESTNILGLGVSQALGVMFHNIGLALMPAVYFISIKRLSMVFNVLTGKIFFDEVHTLERFVGATLMISGVILIAFS